MTLYTQWVTLAVMFSSGILLGILLDIFHLIQDRMRLSKWIHAWIDLLYWFLSACLVFVLLLWSNWGEIRFYIFVAICAGYFVYFKWISPLMVPLLREVLRLIEVVLKGLLFLVLFIVWVPLSKCLKGIQALFRFIIAPLYKNREKK